MLNLLLGICFWRKVREERNWAESWGRKGVAGERRAEMMVWFGLVVAVILGEKGPGLSRSYWKRARQDQIF